jgi:hypothetical protein
MNSHIDADLKDELTTEIRLLLKMGFNLSPDQLTIVLGEKEWELQKLISLARRLSFLIQREILSCRLLVVMAPNSSTSLGTYLFIGVAENEQFQTKNTYRT